MGSGRIVRLVLACELRRICRDRRALLFALVLPIVVYPLLFLFSSRVEEVGREALEARTLHVAADLRALPPALAADLSSTLAQPETLVVLGAVEIDGPPEPEAARELLSARGADLLAVAAPPDEGAGPAVLYLFYDDADDDSDEALRRVRDAADAVLLRARDAVLVEHAGGDPGRRYEARALDVARAEDTAGRLLGALLPLLAVLVLISGGSLAALDAFAGEREAGTLETLLVQPAPARAVAWGKFLAVLAMGLFAFLGNALSLLLCLARGMGTLPALPAELDWTATALRLLRGCALFLPTAALLAAVLALIAARARTFRQGQLLTMPFTFLALALAAPAAQPTTDLGIALALVPLTGGALALRDAAAGVHAPLLQGLAFAASLGWAALALSRLSSTLDAERLLVSSDAPAEGAARRLAAARALRFGLAAALVIYVVGGRVQTASPVTGLLVTLWVLALGLALFFARGTARAEGLPLPSALGLRAPRAAHALGALLLAPATALAVERLFHLQQRLLPMPARLEEASLVAFGLDLPLWALLFVLAVSPGICEELLFRGALQPWWGLVPAAIVFALLHVGPGVRFLPWTISALVIGLVFGFLTSWLGDLGAPIAAHFVINYMNLDYITRIELPAES